MPTGLTIHAYDTPPHLGRHQVLDRRSLAYCRPYDGQPLRATEWEPCTPVLDQQNLRAQGIRTSQLYPLTTDVDALSSCTGNAATALLSVLLSREDAASADLNMGNPASAEEYAIGLYADATSRDEWHDALWPSRDVGSSGLGVAKVLRARGLVDQYGHATTAEELCALLQTGPVLMGMPWYAQFDDPGPGGFIDSNPNWATSPVEGGHEVCVTALEAVATDNGALLPAQTILRFRNSWSTGWGDHGDGRLTLATYLALRAEIDIIQPRLDYRSTS